MRLTQSALEDLECLSRTTQQRIVDRLEFIAMHDDPLSLGKPLVGYRGFWRFRAGDYRIVAELSKDVLTVHLVARRDSAYKGL